MERQKIKGFEEYEIDTVGNVYSKYGKLMKLETASGYLLVKLRMDGKYHRKRVHRLVWITFRGRVRDTINHKDGVKTNNSLGNLEDISFRENQLHWRKAIDTSFRNNFTGVTLRKNGYRARLRNNGKVYETTKNTEAKAVEWYKAKCKELGITSKYLRR